MNLPSMISGSVRNTFSHLPRFGTRRVETSIDQFGNIGKFGTRDHVGRPGSVRQRPGQHGPNHRPREPVWPH